MEIYKFLKQADIYVCKHKDSLERAILLSCLVFPLLEKSLKSLKKIHLGIIIEETKKLINEIFSYFFHLPRKIKIAMISILADQFRFTPIIKLKKRIRIPNDPFFNLAMKFFKIRTMEDKNLLKVYTEWHEHLVDYHARKK